MKLFRRLMLSVTLGLTALFAGASAAQELRYDGWLYGEDAEEALDYAIENDIPIAMMYTWSSTDCGLCMGAARTMAASRPNRQMIRIAVYHGPGSASLNTERVTQLWRQVNRQISDSSNWIPDLYYLTAEGQALGFVAYEDANQTSDKANTVLQIAEWKDSVTGTLARADAEAERGRYTQALERVEEIVSQDAQVSHLIQVQIGQADEDDAMPDQPVSQFFPNLFQQKHDEYAALAMEKVEEARQHFEDGELARAMSLLRPMTRGPQSFEATAAAQTLLDQVMQARRSQ